MPVIIGTELRCYYCGAPSPWDCPDCERPVCAAHLELEGCPECAADPRVPCPECGTLLDVRESELTAAEWDRLPQTHCPDCQQRRQVAGWKEGR